MSDRRPRNEGPPETSFKRTKTHLACNTCRRRKSRCDGGRPSCRRCSEIGLACNYQDRGVNLETDASVLTRLAALESCLESIQQNATSEPSTIVTSPPIGENAAPSTNELRLPNFHHGGGHKIMQYWSRLRVRLSISDVNVLQYLKVADQEDFVLSDTFSIDQFEAEIDPSFLILRAVAFYAGLSQLPIAMSSLIKHCDLFSFGHISAGLRHSTSPHSPDDIPKLRNMSVEQLLIYSAVLKSTPTQESGLVFAPDIMSETCFKLALQSLWKVHLEPDNISVPLILCFAEVYLYCFNKPFHALSMLQIADSAVGRLANRADEQFDQATLELRNTGFEASPRPFKAPSVIYSQLFYMIQSDILSEIDGTPSMRVPSISPDEIQINPQHHNLTPRRPLNSNIGGQTGDLLNSIPTWSFDGTSDGSHDSNFLFTTNLWLRACLNRILSKMFTTSQAYCQPDDVGPIITQISSDLDAWYQSLPRALHFCRDVRTFKLLKPTCSAHLKEISIRYHASVFILNRPVLYWILYQDIEHSATSPSNDAAERNLDIWVLNSCYACIESAKLIILNLAELKLQTNIDSDTFTTPILSWCDVQHLVGAWAVLLSVQMASQFSHEFRDQTEIDRILDLAEGTLAQVANQSLGFMRTLDILTNIRQDFQNLSPMAAAS